MESSKHTHKTRSISNDLTYKEQLDIRTLSSFGDKEFVFPPYDANQLREILEDRARIGFKEGVLQDAVIPLCAALAAQEHGDARKALMLLKFAGEIAFEKGKEKIEEEDVRDAQERLELDRIIEAVKTLQSASKEGSIRYRVWWDERGRYCYYLYSLQKIMRE